MAKEINPKDIKVGDKLRVVSTYSSYGANEQETIYHVEAREDKGKLILWDLDENKRWGCGINSYAQFYPESH